MSGTPVSVDELSPIGGAGGGGVQEAVDLQEQMQLMIHLQNEQQRHYSSDNLVDLETTNKNEGTISIGEKGPESKQHQSTATKTTTSNASTTFVPPKVSGDEVVGKGTLIWEGETKEKKDSSTSKNSNVNNFLNTQQEQKQELSKLQQQQQKQQLKPAAAVTELDSLIQSTEQKLTAAHPNTNTTTVTQLSPTTKSTAAAAGQQQQQQPRVPRSLASYGGLNQQTLLDDDITPIPAGQHHLHYHNNSARNQNMRRQQQQQQQQQQHDYHYGNPDYHDHYDDPRFVDSNRGGGGGRNRYSSSPKRSCIVWFCCVAVWEPIRNCIRDFLQAEAFHRSFCYGAIDGMLTGAGIVSTFCGMNMMSMQTNTYSEIRALVVVFTAATCFADSVCMALGHIWTTHVLAAAQARERTEARIQLTNHKADAKGMLVDMLLQKGMLKIDAMSLADTLEGYPDLFVSALTGDSLTAPPPVTNQQQQHLDTMAGTDIAVGRRQQQQQQIPGEDTHLVSGNAGGPPHHHQHPNAVSSQYHSRGFPSYGRLTDFDMDPDAAVVTTANQESRRESFFMMMGFSLFAVVPSLIYTWVPTLVMNEMMNNHSNNDDDYSSAAGGFRAFDDGFSPKTSSSAAAASVNPNSLAIAITACIMWCLGVWKSRFLDSNWLVFGIEIVSVLFVCILCAYGLGATLNHLFLPNEYQITVITAPTSTSSHGFHL